MWNPARVSEESTIPRKPESVNNKFQYSFVLYFSLFSTSQCKTPGAPQKSHIWTRQHSRRARGDWVDAMKWLHTLRLLWLHFLIITPYFINYFDFPVVEDASLTVPGLSSSLPLFQQMLIRLYSGIISFHYSITDSKVRCV